MKTLTLKRTGRIYVLYNEPFLCEIKLRKLFKFPKAYRPDTVYVELSPKPKEGFTKVWLEKEEQGHGFCELIKVEGSNKGYEVYEELSQIVMGDFGGTVYVSISYDYIY